MNVNKIHVIIFAQLEVADEVVDRGSQTQKIFAQKKKFLPRGFILL